MKAIKNGRKILLAAIMAVTWCILGMTAEAAPETKESQAVPESQEGQGAQEIQEIPVNNTYIIDKNGMGDFETIQEGVDQASDGDTLVIYPGVYTEEVSVIDKGLNIIGVDRDSCVIQYDTTSYMHMPLTIGAGKVSNLTIYGMTATLEQTPVQEDILPNGAVPLDWQKDCPGYAVHIDQSVLYKRSLSFENCRIVSENNACVGIGGRGKSSITFEKCEMVSLRGSGCIYMHDPISLTEYGETAFILKDCSLINCRSPYVMTFWSYMPEFNSLKLTFQNTRVSAVAYGNDKDCVYSPVNVNSFFDVDELMQFEKKGSLYKAGLTSTAAELVHELTIPESKDYIRKLNETTGNENVLDSLEDMLPEGITYLYRNAKDGNTEVKRQVIAIYNNSNMPGNGWCGLGGAYLTFDSFGNTLPEMNAPTAVMGEVLTRLP